MLLLLPLLPMGGFELSFDEDAAVVVWTRRRYETNRRWMLVLPPLLLLLLPLLNSPSVDVGPINSTLLTAYIFFPIPFVVVSSSLLELPRGAGISATNDNFIPPLLLLLLLLLSTLSLHLNTYINTIPVSVPTHTTPGNIDTHRGLPCEAKLNAPCEDGL